MNIKIKSAGVFCLIGDDYDKVFVALKKQFGESDEQLFTERSPGHEYLQWELPGDGWVALSASDPLMSQEVKRELLRRQQNIIKKFGKNQAMAQKVLSVPDDDYVYYKHDDAGRLVIKLTAWGYRYPERVGGGDATADLQPKEETEYVSISLMYDGRPLPKESLRLNGFLRVTDVNGILAVGDLPLGYQFDIEVDKQKHHVTVMPGQGEIKIDLTKYTTVEVRATFDNAPYLGAKVALSYAGRNMQLTCDNNGHATAKLPLDKEGGLCTVIIDNSTQQESLIDSGYVFVFQLTSPRKEEEKEKEEEKDKIVDESSGAGHPETGDDVISSQDATVEIKVTLDDVPYPGVQVSLSYAGSQSHLVCDDNGYATVQLPLDKDNGLCRVSVGDIIQQNSLKEGVNAFEFNLQSKAIVSPDPPLNDTPEKETWCKYLLEIFAALVLACLVCLTYGLCGGLLFG